jgi:5-(carboxyamino)imidazole ribonucleotide synthase
VDTQADLDAAIAQIGLPAVLKTRRLGYDGKGQIILREPADAATAWAALGDAPLIIEGFVPFARELSILAARDHNGETAFFPLVENHHRDGILRLSLAPAPGTTRALQAAAERIAARALAALEYVGVLAIELFQVPRARDWGLGAGRAISQSPVSSPQPLLVNEMAPRVHNSGHWTIEGAETSQFEQHLRAVLGLPLGTTTARGFSAMVNLIGALPDPAAVLAIPGAHLHLYGKQPRAGRKVGHVTIRADARGELEERLARVQSLIELPQLGNVSHIE